MRVLPRCATHHRPVEVFEKLAEALAEAYVIGAGLVTTFPDETLAKMDAALEAAKPWRKK